MKFIITCTGSYDTEKLKEEYQKVLGTKKETVKDHRPDGIIEDFELHILEVNTIEELLQKAKDIGKDLVFSHTLYGFNMPTLEIYDDYRE